MLLKPVDHVLFDLVPTLRTFQSNIYVRVSLVTALRTFQFSIYVTYVSVKCVHYIRLNLVSKLL